MILTAPGLPARGVPKKFFFFKFFFSKFKQKFGLLLFNYLLQTLVCYLHTLSF